MARVLCVFATLVIVLAAVSSCKSSTPSTSAKTYRLKAGSIVPPEFAREIESKEYREGHNELVEFRTGKLFAVISNGALDSLILEEQGQPPTVVPIARMPDPPPNPTDEIPRNCNQKYDDCIARCASAPDPQCCKCRCFVEWYLCTSRVGGSLAGGISLI